MGAPKNTSLAAVVMAGGSGTRFWPSSRKDRPKQYLDFFGDRSLIQQTVNRIVPLVGIQNVYVCSTESQRKLLIEQLPEISPQTQLIIEPVGKNTAPCIALSAIHLLKSGLSPETVMVVLPADHYIGDEVAFKLCIEEACALARSTGGLVTLGIIPTVPHTGYGYIEAGDKVDGGNSSRFHIKQFVEKPDRGRAEKYVMSGRHYWNGGIFLWTLQAIQESYETHLPRVWKALSSAQSPSELAATYQTLPSVAVDVAIMEKAKNGYVIPAGMRWSDVGSWDAVYQLNAPSVAGNVVLSGEVHALESRGCLVKAPKDKKVALLGVENLVVIDEGNSLLICTRDHDQLVREASKKFES